MTDNHIIFGTRAVMEALQAGRDIDKILIKKDRQGNDLLRELHDLLRGRLIPVQHVPVERLNRITRKNPNQTQTTPAKSSGKTEQQPNTKLKANAA